MQETSSYNVRVTNFILRLSIWIKFGKRIIKCLPIGSLEADEGQSKMLVYNSVLALGLKS
jgi:hypothetical protein